MSIIDESGSSGMTNWTSPIALGTPHPTGVAQRRPWPVGHFKTRLVKPIVPFLTTLYLRAQLIHQLARNVHVFHMQSIYIARQALHLVILLNDAVDMNEGPSNEQDDERNDLEDELVELSKAMTKWGSGKGDDFEYERQAVEIEQQHARLFKGRSYFHDLRDCSTDSSYQKFVAYDAKTIRYRQRRETPASMLLTSPRTTPKIPMVSSSSPPIPGTLPASSHPMPGYAHAQSSMQSVNIRSQPEYVYGPIAVARARDERQFGQNDNPGQAMRTAEVYPSAAYIPYDPDVEHQGQGYYLAPLATQWFSEPPAASFVEPSGWVAQNYQTDHNSMSVPHDSLQPRVGQFSALPSSSTAHPDLRQYFPLDNDEHMKKRDALKAVMQSHWKQNNEFEPEASLLLQFMSLDPSVGRWYCTFWKDGRPCDCSCKKQDHAKGHIRSHIDFLPFVCDSRCPYSAAGCARRYPAAEPLQKHRRGKTMCDHCGLPILPDNMKRHAQFCHPDTARTTSTDETSVSMNKDPRQTNQPMADANYADLWAQMSITVKDERT